MNHELKIMPEYFEAVFRWIKPFEIRRNDRGFAVGDILRLWEHEFDRDKGTVKWFDGEATAVSLFDLSIIKKHSFKIATEFVVDIPDDYIDSIKTYRDWGKYTPSQVFCQKIEYAKQFNLSMDKDYVYPAFAHVVVGTDVPSFYSR